MGLSRRNRRVAFYSYSDTGADGFTRGEYTLAGTYWCSFVDTENREGTAGAKAQHLNRAVLALGWGIPVDANMLAVIDSTPYYVRGISGRRARNAKHVSLEAVTDDNILSAIVDPLLADGSVTADGSEFADGTRSLAA